MSKPLKDFITYAPKDTAVNKQTGTLLTGEKMASKKSRRRKNRKLQRNRGFSNCFTALLQKDRTTMQQLIEIAPAILNEEVLNKSKDVSIQDTDFANRKVYGEPKYKFNYVKFICAYASHALTYARSILDSGDSPTSLSLARTLFEMGINFDYVKSCPKLYLPQFYENLAGYADARICIALHSGSDLDQRTEIVQIRKDIFKTFGKPKAVTQWSGRTGNVLKRARAIGLENVYHSLYTIFSYEGHGSPATLIFNDLRSDLSDKMFPQRLTAACIFWSIGLMIEHIIKVFPIPEMPQAKMSEFSRIKGSADEFVKEQFAIFDKAGQQHRRISGNGTAS